MARIRSPNYPALSLPAAIERIQTLRKAEGKNAMDREAAAKHLGFGSLNGASSTVLSALSKYGLLDRVGEGEVRVSELATRILFADDEQEKRAALMVAAFRPALFAEIREKWPDRPPSEESLRSFLMRNGFSEGGAGQVIQFYRETLDIVGRPSPPHDAPSAPEAKEAQMIPEPVAPSNTGGEHSTPSLPAGKPFRVVFDGSVLTGTIAIRSVREIDRLLKVLTAQKAAFEAMQDDEDDEEAGAAPSGAVADAGSGADVGLTKSGDE